MNRALLTLLATGLGLIPALAAAETLPLPLSGPAYTAAHQAYSAYERKDYDLAIAKAREALRLRADVTRLHTLIAMAERDKKLRDQPRVATSSRAAPAAPGFVAASQAYKAYDQEQFALAAQAARKAIAQAPRRREYRLLLIDALQRQHLLVEADQAVGDALGVFAHDDALLMRRKDIRRQLAAPLAVQGYRALQQGNRTLALEKARKAVAWAPEVAANQQLLDSALLDADDSEAPILECQESAFGLTCATRPVNTDKQAPVSDLQLAYDSVRSGDDETAHAAFRRADATERLKPAAAQDAAYNAMRVHEDDEAVAYFKRVIDGQKTAETPMSAQQLFDTRRTVGDVSRRMGLTSTTSYRGNSSSGLSAAPSTGSSGSQSNDLLQNSTELSWRPLGYRNARFVELYGRITDTLWSKNSDSDTGADALQGALGVRIKPFSSVNIMAAFERTFPLGSSNVEGDWLARLGYGSSIGTDLRVDAPSWWTSQLYAEVGRYLNDSRNYFNSEWQVGRSYAIGGTGSRWVTFPHVVAAIDYDSKMKSAADGDFSSGNAGGIGVGNNIRYWFREDAYNAPRSYVDFSLQYRARVFGEERAKGVFARLTYSY
ncbi:NfrA family protein [Pseudomonas fluorescens]|uniref:Bacteriophage N4 adsorption protein A n=1 Tax=Pseudomonas fluorescens TaxID=294 RepID=A0A944DQ28_PSEFL|nr:bacteriophage N4 adsorption protein A [Pseudomonas fluorescens]MBT2294897.1 bacteriophage N4 adsorption protein A [Pseudomonas fluorescens]MBT2308411.1 bacteriophage N4 adsorption protein A [Pseudomonas fluorescens]MBT2311481.1 bacteriophage N4 adsorption protein A [Pseudomonas fluorescens]MBT2319854.1 bacteriophage N4 adsorption protein A [Pseudomonas fluorescens]MBT2332138.1 bacteriophage N4 adsorption protein A [Pseudomonas fluorescens]